MAGIAQELAQNFSGPVIFYYVWWVLWEAKKRGLKRLYFLARDGYTLHKIAEQFCRQFDLGIQCNYLYCSRAALRMPTYFFIGDEAFDLLFCRGYYVTLKSLLQRGELTDEERLAVYKECGISDVDENRILSHRDFDYYVSKIKESRTLHTSIIKRSRDAYINAIGYFKEEGLMEQNIIAIVDSGWIGSMQRSFRQLMEFAGYSGTFIGFYFGMYVTPQARADGEYLTWCFNPSTSAQVKAKFCNNLFECLLSAPHGMTVSYMEKNDGYKPVLLSAPTGRELALISEQLELISEYSARELEQICFDEFDAPTFLRDTISRIKRYMFQPTREQASYYGQFLFCDDVTDAYQLALADQGQQRLLKDYSILRRLFQRVTGWVPDAGVQAELFWPYGTASFLPYGKRQWYKLNIYVWEWIKQRHHAIKSKQNYPEQDPDAYRQEIELHKIVSFDIFDTLLYRTVNQPDDVFRLMEPWACETYGILNFAQKRIEAEKKARRLTKNGEVTLASIYEAFGTDRQIAETLAQYELQTELYVLRRDDRMAELLSYCAANGKRVLIISDMYLDKNFLQLVLKRAGLYAYDVLYVSSEENATKATGSLYDRIIEKEEIQDRKLWLHIGNDLHSDYIVPKALGISVLLYKNGRTMERPVISVPRYLVYVIKAKVNSFFRRRGKQE